MSEWNQSPMPQDKASVDDAKLWSGLAYGVPLAGYIFTAGLASFIGSIVLYALAKEKSPLVRQHAAGALNLQLNALLWTLVSILLMIVFIGFLTIFIVIIWALVLNVIGLIKALNLEPWDPPMCIKFVR